MALEFKDRVRVYTATTGTSDLTLGAAFPGYRTFSSASVTNGATVKYTLEEGVAWEVGVGTYNSGTGVLARTTVEASSAGGTTKITLTGSATVWIDVSAAWLVSPSFTGLISQATTSTGGTFYPYSSLHSAMVNNDVEAFLIGSAATSGNASYFGHKKAAIKNVAVFGMLGGTDFLTVDESGNLANNGATWYIDATGNSEFVQVYAQEFGLFDTNIDHTLDMVVGEDLTADRDLTIIVNDADRVLTIPGNATISGTMAVASGKVLTVSNTLTFTGTDGTTQNFPEVSADIGFRGIPQNSKSADYTIAATDNGKHVYHPGADTTARTWTINSNANLALPIGFTVTFVNDTLGGIITIAITADTLVWMPSGSTGSRFLAANGIATIIKIASTRWALTGVGLT